MTETNPYRATISEAAAPSSNSSLLSRTVGLFVLVLAGLSAIMFAMWFGLVMMGVILGQVGTMVDDLLAPPVVVSCLIGMIATVFGFLSGLSFWSGRWNQGAMRLIITGFLAGLAFYFVSGPQFQ